MFTNRDLALIAAFSAILLGYGYFSSIVLRTFTRSMDLFFLISALFAILACVVQKRWAATLLATITGLIFLGTPAPFVPHIAASLIANGLVFDVYLTRVDLDVANPRFRSNVVVAAASGSIVMAGVGLVILQAVGVPLPAFVWAFAIVGDTLVGVAGALFGLGVAKRIRGAKTTIVR